MCYFKDFNGKTTLLFPSEKHIRHTRENLMRAATQKKYSITSKYPEFETKAEAQKYYQLHVRQQKI